MRGSFRMVRAMATRCFSPPESFSPRSPTARVVAVRQAEDEIMHLREPRRVLDLVLRRARPAIGDVVADRVVEQHGVLRHHADRRAQAVLREVAQIVAVDQDAPAGHVVEAEQQAADGRFAGAGRPDDRELAAGGHGEAHALAGSRAPACSRTARPRTGSSPPRRSARCGGERDGARPVRDLLVHGEQAEHLLHVHQPLLDLAIDEAEEIERLVELHQIGVHQHELADRHGAGLHALRRHQHDRARARPR